MPQSGHVEGLRPARLKVGLISAGRVGTALGVALERAEHVVVSASAVRLSSLEAPVLSRFHVVCCEGNLAK